MLYPNVPISAAFQRRLVDYVNDGGRLLVVDAGMGDVPLTSNQILRPFGLSLDYTESWSGDLVLKDSWPMIHVDHAWEVVGGKKFAELSDQRTVCATAEYGKGLVMVVSFGTLFNDKNFGGDWAKDPTPEERTRYDVLFAILRRLVKDEPLVVPPARMAPPQPSVKPPPLVRPARKNSPPRKAELPTSPKGTGATPAIPSDKGPLMIPEPMDTGLQPSPGTK